MFITLKRAKCVFQQVASYYYKTFFCNVSSLVSSLKKHILTNAIDHDAIEHGAIDKGWCSKHGLPIAQSPSIAKVSC